MIESKSLTMDLLANVGFTTVAPDRDPELVVVVHRSIDGSADVRAWSVRSCPSATDTCSDHPHGPFEPGEVMACRQTAKAIVDGACLAGSAIVLFARDAAGTPALHTVSFDSARHGESAA